MVDERQMVDIGFNRIHGVCHRANIIWAIPVRSILRVCSRGYTRRTHDWDIEQESSPDGRHISGAWFTYTCHSGKFDLMTG